MVKLLLAIVIILNSCRFKNEGEINNYSIDSSKKNTKLDKMYFDKEVNDTAFSGFWVQFVEVVETSDFKKLKTMSLSNLFCENKIISIENFLSQYYSKIFDDTVKRIIHNPDQVDFITKSLIVDKIHPTIKNQLKESLEIVNARDVNLNKENEFPPIIIVLNFIETKNGYRFSGYNQFHFTCYPEPNRN